MTSVKPGDFFVATWGYDQTNKTFWRVDSLSASGKTVTVTRMKTVLAEDQPASGIMDLVVPGSEPELEWRHEVVDGELVSTSVPDTSQKRLRDPDDDPSFKAFSWGTRAWLWDGTPQRQTNPLFGH